jgi:hypothetical protein
MNKLGKKWEDTDRWHILAAILAPRRQPVASVIALDPLSVDRYAWLPTSRRTDRASKTADKYGTFHFFPFFNGIQPRCPFSAIPSEYSPDGDVQWLRI